MEGKINYMDSSKSKALCDFSFFYLFFVLVGVLSHVTLLLEHISSTENSIDLCTEYIVNSSGLAPYLSLCSRKLIVIKASGLCF